MKYHYFQKRKKASFCLLCTCLLLFSTAFSQTKTTTIDYGTYSGVGLNENTCTAFLNGVPVNVLVNGVSGYTLAHTATVGTQRYFQSKGSVDLPVVVFANVGGASGYSISYPFKDGYTYKLSITGRNGSGNVSIGLWWEAGNIPQIQTADACIPQGYGGEFADLLTYGKEIAFNSTVTTFAFDFTINGNPQNYLNFLSGMFAPAADVKSVSINKIEILETAPSNLNCALPAPAGVTNTTNQDYSSTLSWSPVAGAFQYKVNVSDIHNGVATQQTFYTNITSVRYCALGAGDGIAFDVQAICDNDMLGAASVRSSFSSPYPPAPTNFSYDFSNCNKVQWQPISGAGSYTLLIRDLTAGTGPVTFTTPNYAAYVESDLHLISGHNYQATVSANGGNGCTYQTQTSAPITFTAITPYLPAPTSLSYDGNANTLSWSAIPNSTNYSIQYQDLTTNSGVQYASIYHNNSISGTTLSLINRHSYQAAVAAVNQACNNYTSAYSGWYGFTAGPPPPPPCLPPTIVYPTAIGNKMVQVQFLAPTSGQTPINYNIKLDNGASQFFNNVGTTSPVTIRSNGAGLYTLSMQSVCPTGTSNYVSWRNQINVSSTRMGATATGNVFGDAGIDANGNAFTVYPVPSQGQVGLSFQSAEKQTAEIVVTNGVGSIVLKKKIGVINGQNTYMLDAGQLANGFYTIRIIIGQSSQIQKLVIQK